MKTTTEKKQEARERRHKKIRSRIRGTAERPRLSIFKSNRRVVAQLIDDERGVTLVAADASTKKAVKSEKSAKKTKTESARETGKSFAEAARKIGIKEAAFDRGGFRYTGRIAAFAEGVREGGLKV